MSSINPTVTDIVIICVVIPAVLLSLAWFFNRPTRLSGDRLAEIDKQAKTSSDWFKAGFVVSDANWVKGYRTFKQLDEADQANVLLAIMFWFEATTTRYPDINDIITHLDNKYPTLPRIALHMTSKVIENKMNVEQVRTLHVNVLYRWLLEFKG